MTALTSTNRRSRGGWRRKLRDERSPSAERPDARRLTRRRRRRLLVGPSRRRPRTPRPARHGSRRIHASSMRSSPLFHEPRLLPSGAAGWNGATQDLRRRPPAGRFSKSGHTHHPRLASPRRQSPRGTRRRRDHRALPCPRRARFRPGIEPPTYHRSQSAINGPQQKRGIVGGSNRLARTVTRKVIAASKADGAHESGLTALIWNQVLSYGTDAMITVALAGTVFFGASDARPARQRAALPAGHDGAVRGGRTGHRAGAGPPAARAALDDGRHRRSGRAILAVDHGRASDRPARALSRARSARWCCPRPTASSGRRRRRGSCPPGMTLVEANARLSIFGLACRPCRGRPRRRDHQGDRLVHGRALASPPSRSRPARSSRSGCPRRSTRREPAADIPRSRPGHAASRRCRHCSRHHRRGPSAASSRQVDHRRCRAKSALRFLSGFLTIYLAFYVESTRTAGTAALRSAR